MHPTTSNQLSTEPRRSSLRQVTFAAVLLIDRTLYPHLQVSASSPPPPQSELVFYEALTSQEFVDRLFGFFSLEEVKGKDQFDVHKFDMFKVC